MKLIFFSMCKAALHYSPRGVLAQKCLGRPSVIVSIVYILGRELLLLFFFLREDVQKKVV